MALIKNNKYPLVFLLVAISVALDQLTKVVARREIGFQERIEVLGSYFTLTRVENTGAFLSMGDELPEWLRFTLLSIMPLGVLGFGFYYLLSTKDLPLSFQVGICLLLGGGIGNIYDRLMYGSVTDFMHMDFGLVQTGVFNIADVSIMIGIGILLLLSFQKKITEPLIDKES